MFAIVVAAVADVIFSMSATLLVAVAHLPPIQFHLHLHLHTAASVAAAAAAFLAAAAAVHVQPSRCGLLLQIAAVYNQKSSVPRLAQHDCPSVSVTRSLLWHWLRLLLLPLCLLLLLLLQLLRVCLFSLVAAAAAAAASGAI